MTKQRLNRTKPMVFRAKAGYSILGNSLSDCLEQPKMEGSTWQLWQFDYDWNMVSFETCTVCSWHRSAWEGLKAFVAGRDLKIIGKQNIKRLIILTEHQCIYIYIYYMCISTNQLKQCVPLFNYIQLHAHLLTLTLQLWKRISCSMDCCNSCQPCSWTSLFLNVFSQDML